MSKTHVVSVNGVMKANGQMANFGEEVSKDDFNNFNDRIEGNYVMTKDEFKSFLEKNEVKDPEAAAKKKDEEAKAASVLKAKNELLAKYENQFGHQAPKDATEKAIQDAINNKTIIKAS